MSLLLFSLMLAGAPSPSGAGEPALERPTVHLAADEALTDWMVWRLLEEGYPLTASAEAADIELAVAPASEGSWTVMAKGESTVAFDVETSTDLAVIRLELLHRSLDALEDVTPRSAEGPEPATVGITIDADSPPSLAPSVAAEVLAAGATLVPSGVPAQLRVCASGGAEEEPSVTIVDGASECGVSAETEPAFTSALLPTTAQRVEAAIAALGQSEAVLTETVRDEPDAVVPEPVEPADDAERAPGLDAGPGPEPLRTPLVGAPLVLRGGLAVGAIGRLTVPDAIFVGSMTFGREPGVQGWLELQVRPTNVVGRFKVVEVVPALGIQVRPLKVRRTSLLLGVLLGLETHSYWLRADQLRTQGTHISGSAEAALGFAIEVWKQHEVQLAFRAGSGAERVHEVEGEEIWRRNTFRFGGTLGFAFGRVLGR